MDAETHNILASGPYTICVRLLLFSWSQQLSKPEPSITQSGSTPQIYEGSGGFCCLRCYRFPPTSFRRKTKSYNFWAFWETIQQTSIQNTWNTEFRVDVCLLNDKLNCDLLVSQSWPHKEQLASQKKTDLPPVAQILCWLLPSLQKHKNNKRM